MRRLTSWIFVALMSLAVVGGMLAFGAGRASAATCTAYPAGCSSPVTSVPVAAPTVFTPAQPAAVASTTSGTLPFTGADVGGTVIAGVVLIGAGVVVVGATRRRRSS